MVTDSYSTAERILMAVRLRQLAKEMTHGDPKTAAMLIQAAKMIERQPRLDSSDATGD